MPLKIVPPRKGKSPNWTIRGTYLDVYVDRSAGTRKRAVAEQVRKGIERSIERGVYAEGKAQTFAGAAAAYMKAGGEPTFLTPLIKHFGECALSEIGQDAIDEAASRLYPNASGATRNRQVYTPVSAILKRAGVAFAITRPIDAQGHKAVAWLWPEQAFALFAEAERIDKRFGALLIVLCYTGLRLSEALRLTWNDVRLDDGYAHIPDTKNGDPRGVFLPAVAVRVLADQKRGVSDRVFPYAKSGHLYALLRAAAFKAGVDLPHRGAFHLLRHTFATWMRRYGGLDTRGLVATGAWRDRKSAERYAHVVVSEEARRAELLPVPKSVIG